MDRNLAKKHPFLKYKYYLMGGLLVILLIIYLMVNGRGSQLHYDGSNIVVSDVKQDKFHDYTEVEGIIFPKLTIKLTSSESGIVDRIVADDGSTLKQGDTIMVLKNSELLRSIEDEKDDLEKQRVSYKEKQLEMQRKSSELKRKTLKTTYDLARLKKQHNIDQEEFKIGIQSKAQLEVASDEYVYNQKDTKLLLDELTHDSLMNTIQTDLMNNDLLREEKRFTRSQERLQELIVRAPISGQLSFISVIPGEKVTEGISLGELKVVDQYKIKALVSDYYIDRISVGLPATISYQNKKYSLKIMRVNPEVKDRQFEVYLAFTNSLPDNIRIGKSYQLQIELSKPEEALVMDRGNFYQSTGGQWVYKLNTEGTKAVRTAISIGRQNPKQYEILSGLEAGDQVIISGYDSFGDVQELILK